MKRDVNSRIPTFLKKNPTSNLRSHYPANDNYLVENHNLCKHN